MDGNPGRRPSDAADYAVPDSIPDKEFPAGLVPEFIKTVHKNHSVCSEFHFRMNRRGWRVGGLSEL